jgi:hypothetical protein
MAKAWAARELGVKLLLAPVDAFGVAVASPIRPGSDWSGGLDDPMAYGFDCACRRLARDDTMMAYGTYKGYIRRALPLYGAVQAARSAT